MARFAHKGRTIRLALVGVERVAKSFVRNVSHGHVDECSVRATVIRVTGPARHAGFFLQLIAVQGGWILQLGSHIGMALQATIGHRRILPEKGMAGGTLSTQLSMGSDSAQICARLGIECTWTEKHASPHQPHPDYNQDNQHSGDKTGNCQAAKWLFPHRIDSTEQCSIH
jgi:hypothetical protein